MENIWLTLPLTEASDLTNYLTWLIFVFSLPAAIVRKSRNFTMFCYFDLLFLGFAAYLTLTLKPVFGLYLFVFTRMIYTPLLSG